MPLVKLTIREEPQDVTDEELSELRGQGLVERLVEPEKPAKATPPTSGKPANGAGNSKETG